MLTSGLNRPIDPKKLAQKGAVLAGEIGASELTRFSSAVVGDYAPIRYQLNFELDDQRLPIMSGNLQANVHLECQRCLAPVAHQLDIEILLRPVLTDAQAVAHQKDVDVVMLDEDGLLNSLQCLEDELLLNLPIVTYHDQDDCVETLEFTAGEELPDETAQGAEENPFSILAQLKRADKEE